MKKPISKPVKALLAVLLLATVAWGATVRWVMKTWAHLTLEQLLFQLGAPMTGTGSDIILQGIVNIGAPLLVCLLLLVWFLRRKWPRWVALLCAAASLACDAAAGIYAWNRLDAGVYLENQSQESTFVQENYANPQSVELTFPEKKRNLIYIYLESMETTYADEASGGAFPQNVIPELTRLAEQNECFAGTSGQLNGGHPMPGTTWTMGGLFAQTSGLPLQLDFDVNGMNTQQSFFPGITCLGDILAENGYRQVFLLGSRAEFGGRELYFTSHGGYEMRDYDYAMAQGLIPQGYYVFWGYEDARLFENAKNTLTELAAGDEPFNLTMLTVDTHFEDGYLCDLCPDTFGSNQYANVIACSSKQVAEFVQWVQQQNFYDDTTIVISGDHLTMDTDFCDDVDAAYDRRTYTAYINADAAPADAAQTRTFTTFDNFPTTLAAMGVKIDGDRLGLGTNLFSATPTLAEEYGLDTLNTELARKSTFVEGLSGVDATLYDAYQRSVATAINPAGTVNVRAQDTRHGTLVVRDLPDKAVERVTVTLTDMDDENTQTIEAELQPDRSYTAALDLTAYDRGQGALRVTVKPQHGDEYELYTYAGQLLLACETDFAQYLANLRFLQNDGYAFFFTVYDEAARAFTGAMQQRFQALGFRSYLLRQEETSFLAVSCGDTLREKMAMGTLTMAGKLPDGSRYRLRSSARQFGNETCIVIENGSETDYALHKSGFNIVVYDYERSAVVNRASFDTHRTVPTGKVTVVRNDSGTYTLRLKELTLDHAGRKRLVARFWDADHRDAPQEFTLRRLRDGSYRVTAALQGLDTTNCYMEICAVSQDGREEVIAQLRGKLDGMAG